MIIMPIKTAMMYLVGRDKPQAIVASAVSEPQISLAMDQIRELLRHRHHIRGETMDDFSVKSIEEAAQTHEEISRVMNMLLVT